MHDSLVRGDEMRDARLRRVRRRAAQVLEAHVLAGHGLHDVGSGDEHVRRALGHQHEVGDRGRVDRAAGARAHDQRNLRHDPGRLNVPPEDLRVARERDDTFLDPRAARVVDPDHGAAHLHGHVHHLADLLREDLRQRAAEHGEVLAEHADRTAEHRAVPRHDCVTPRSLVAHPELALAMAHEPVELDERARVDEQLDSLAGEELAALVLPRDRLLGPGVRRLLAQLSEPGELLLRRLVPRRHRAERNGRPLGTRRGPRPDPAEPLDRDAHHDPRRRVRHGRELHVGA